jgi:hypothetical protein
MSNVSMPDIRKRRAAIVAGRKHKRYGARLLLLSSVLLLGACVPLQTVRPLPDFVALAIKPGDQVELKTHAGEEVEFQASQVDAQSISSPHRRFLLNDIAELYVRSRDRPEYPCGGTQALGCSIPKGVKFTDFVFGLMKKGVSWHSEYADRFYDACVQHDFCYRHGYKTYGHTKEYCDEEFYNNMLASCGAVDVPCMAVAKEFSWAVKEHAEEGAFQKETSTKCQYDGPVTGTEKTSRQP